MINALIYNFKLNKLEYYNVFNDIKPYINNENYLCWIDFFINNEEEYKVLENNFSFHHLTIEDCKHFSLYPKIDEYDEYLFCVFHDISININTLEEHNENYSKILQYYNEDFEIFNINLAELDIFVTQNSIITVHQNKIQNIDNLFNKIKEGKNFLKEGKNFLLYKILDGIIDQYLDVLKILNDVIEILEEEIINDTVKDISEKILILKRNHLLMRRTALCEKEIINKIIRSSNITNIKDKQSIFYFQDLHDHISRIQDNVEINREMLSTMFDAYLSNSSNKTNRAMMKLTAIATIFLPLTFIAGIYGMNFEHMPELKWQYGYLFVWIVFIIVAILSYIHFHKQDMI